jgi:hypothetical protein
VKVIEVIVDPKGGISLEIKGFAGTGCRDATKQLEQALGIVTRDSATPDLFLANRQTQQQFLDNPS